MKARIGHLQHNKKAVSVNQVAAQAIEYEYETFLKYFEDFFEI